MANVLITGCKGGIGLDVAKRLVRKGHFVYLTVHRIESIKSTYAEFPKGSENIKVFKLDILSKKDRLLVNDLNIDVLINNAAIGDSGPLKDIPIDRVKNTFDTNVFATLSFSQIVINNMVKAGKGKVIFIGSMAGLIPMPFLAPYSMTKFALEGLVYALRKEVKPFGIDIIMINPGSFHTGFNQKNMMKKYDWMNLEHYDDDNLKRIKKEENKLSFIELKKTQSIAKKIVLAVQSAHPKKRYVAPLWQWLTVPLLRLFK